MKIKRIGIILFLLLLIVGCNKNLHKEVTLTGEVINRELRIDSETYNVSILNLDDPLIVNGTAVNSVKLNSNEESISEDKVTIKGILEENKDNKVDTLYELDVKDIIK